uniref:Putative replication-associated protein n=1 Tax=viral metagenome TaxID=1070528 RepID=A0A6H1Z746_9ZZZZ
MFIDWLTMYQDFEEKLPSISGERFFVQNTVTGEILRDRQCPITHPGSYSTSIIIKISANRLEVSGNPSRYDRLDNFEGFRTLQDCVDVYNTILTSLRLPNFSKCSRVWRGKADNKGKFPLISDGACIKEIHLTSNQSNGEGMAVTVIRALSTVRYGNSIPHLFTDNNSVTWQSKLGNQRLLRPIVYNKGAELDLHLVPKMRREFGEDSTEYKYAKNLSRYCHENGITRHELNLKPEWLARQNCKFWGLFDESKFNSVHEDFLAMQNKLQINHLKVENVSDQLIRLGICSSKQASNATALYYMQWMNGHQFDLAKSQVKVHRARLRQIGVEIANPCDLTKFASIHVINSREVVSTPAIAPDWYRHPKRLNGLKLVA